MARTWLQVETVLPDHPKTRKLAKLWRCHPYMVGGFLLKLWGYCLEYQADGNVDGRPADVLDELAAPCLGQLLGTHATVRESLEEAGFVDPDGRLHDWEDYSGALFARRAKDRDRKRLARAKRPKDKKRTGRGHTKERARTSAPRVEQSRVVESRAENRELPSSSAAAVT